MEFLLRELTPGENVLAALLHGCARRYDELHDRSSKVNPTLAVGKRLR
jgi:hypothetical protein